jgi:hypothetical protein
MSVLDVKKMRLFPIKRKIEKVAFEFNLFNYFKIHPVISYIYLELTLLEYLEDRAPPPLITIKEEKRYFINRLIRKE